MLKSFTRASYYVSPMHNIELTATSSLGCYNSYRMCTTTQNAYCSLVGATVAKCRTVCADSSSTPYIIGGCGSTGGCEVVLVGSDPVYGLCCQCVPSRTTIGTASFPMTTGCTYGVCNGSDLCGSGSIPATCGNCALNAYLVTPGVFYNLF